MELGEYTVGLLFLAGTWGACLTAAVIAVVRLYPRLGGVPRVLAFGLLATAALVVVHLLPGAVGLLSREAVLVLAAAVLVAVWRLVPQQPGGEQLDAPDPSTDSGPLSWGIVAVAAAALAVAVAAEVTFGLRSPAADIDSLTFQLPNIGHWIQERSFWSINQFVPLQAHGDYPGNGDLIFLSVMLPFDSDALVRIVGLPFYLLACGSVYAIGCEIRAPRATAALAALVFGALPVMHLASFTGAKTDAIFYAAFGTAILFLLRWIRLGERRELLLAGLGLGLAVGTKWYGITAVPIAVAAWAIAAYAQDRRLRPVLTGGGALVGLSVLFGGFWLLRNWIESGSPLFPQGLPLVAATPHDYVRDCVGFTVADYLGKPDVLREYLWPSLRRMVGLGGPLLFAGWIGAAVTAVLAERRGKQRPGTAVWLLLGATAAMTLAYVITPYTGLGLRDRPSVAGPNVRYLLPAAICAVPLVAWWVGRLRGVRLVGEAVLGAAVLEGIRRGFDLPTRNWVAGFAVLVAGTGLVYGLAALHGRFPQRRYVMAAAALVAIVLAAGLYNRQRNFAAHRYADQQSAIQLLMQTPSGGQRIGLSGYLNPTQFAPVWPAFGPRLQNRVEYVGRFVDGQLNEFPDAQSWRRRIEQRRYDLVAVGYGAYPKECRLPGSESDDNAFARAAGYRLVARSPYLNVYRVR